jgi:hypothetical protein
MEKLTENDYEILDACCELQSIKIQELKAENEALIEGLGIANKYVNKYHKTLREIKTIAEKVIKNYMGLMTQIT